MPPRRFPAPWTTEDNGAALIVKDGSGHAVAYVYYEEEPGRLAAANLMTRDEARRIAANVARLPELVKRPQY
jgi:endo-1,4-beta-D-glucanase Y